MSVDFQREAEKLISDIRNVSVGGSLRESSKFQGSEVWPSDVADC
jgi:hypothetical protein